MRLRQRQHLEQLVERAQPAGKAHQRHRTHQEVHLADGKVVKLKAQLGRDVGVGCLLEGQEDAHPHAAPAGLKGAAIARLHDAGATAGGDDHRLAQRIGLARDQFAKTLRFGVPVRIPHHGLGLAQGDLVTAGERFGMYCRGHVRRLEARAAKHHHG